MKKLLLAIPVLSTFALSAFSSSAVSPTLTSDQVKSDIAIFDLTGKIKPALSQMLDFISENQDFADLSVGEAVYEVEAMINTSSRDINNLLKL